MDNQDKILLLSVAQTLNGLIDQNIKSISLITDLNNNLADYNRQFVMMHYNLNKLISYIKEDIQHAEE